jgi:hypothetical protein
MPPRTRSRRRAPAPSLTIAGLPDELLVLIMAFIMAFENLDEDDVFFDGDTHPSMGSATALLPMRVVSHRFSERVFDPELWTEWTIAVPESGMSTRWDFQVPDVIGTRWDDVRELKTGDDLTAVRRRFSRFGEWIVRNACGTALSNGTKNVEYLKLSNNLLWLTVHVAASLFSNCRNIVSLHIDGTIHDSYNDAIPAADCCPLEDMRLTSLCSLRHLHIERLHELRCVVVAGGVCLNELELTHCGKLETVSADGVKHMKLNAVGTNFRIASMALAMTHCTKFELCSNGWSDESPAFVRSSRKELGFSPAFASALASCGGAPVLREVHLEMNKYNFHRDGHCLRNLSMLLTHAPSLQHLWVETLAGYEWWRNDEELAWPADARVNTSLRRLIIEKIDPEANFLHDLLLQAPGLTTFLISFLSCKDETGPWPLEAYAQAACSKLRSEFTVRNHAGLGLASAESEPNRLWGSRWLRRHLTFSKRDFCGMAHPIVRKAIEEDRLDCVWRARGQTCPCNCDIVFREVKERLEREAAECARR